MIFMNWKQVSIILILFEIVLTLVTIFFFNGDIFLMPLNTLAVVAFLVIMGVGIIWGMKFSLDSIKRNFQKRKKVIIIVNLIFVIFIGVAFFVMSSSPKSTLVDFLLMGLFGALLLVVFTGFSLLLTDDFLVSLRDSY